MGRILTLNHVLHPPLPEVQTVVDLPTPAGPRLFIVVQARMSGVVLAPLPPHVEAQVREHHQAKIDKANLAVMLSYFVTQITAAATMQVEGWRRP